MDVEGTINLLVLALGIATTSAIGFAIAWVRARDRASRAEERLAEHPVRVDAHDDRVDQALEAMAVELERLSEGQRFTTELLARRSAGAGESKAAVPPPIAIPHVDPLPPRST